MKTPNTQRTGDKGRKIDPVEYAKFIMEQMDFTQADLVRFGCGQTSHVSEMINRKRKMTLNFIRILVDKSHRQETAFLLIKDYKL